MVSYYDKQHFYELRFWVQHITRVKFLFLRIMVPSQLHASLKTYRSLVHVCGVCMRVRTLIKLDMLDRRRRLDAVTSHHVVVHQGGPSEQTEAAGRAEHAAVDMLGGLLQPMADGVLEVLVPHHRA